ncbi:dolichyl-diphosphooligosaccharide--protein glycosyltransferase subunit 1 [Pelomyxa schiedti]|nr:dolichyl-diphosphooligosaccharide--protein glycosyltransferase subunit 1 [Pelomyxa schiedti]
MEICRCGRRVGVLVSFVVGILLLAMSANGEIVNLRVHREIDIGAHLAVHAMQLEFKNQGEAEVSTYDCVIPASIKDNLIFLEAKSVPEQKQEENAPPATNLPVQEPIEDEMKNAVYTITLEHPVAANATCTLNIVLAYSHLLTPVPKETKQNENQFIEYKDNHYFYSPYFTNLVVTNVKLPENSKAIRRTDPKPSQAENNTIMYGPFEAIAPFSFEELLVHFPSNALLITVTRLERDIEVSHWGNVAIEERYWVRHDGAELKGAFSRYELQRNSKGSPLAFPYFLLELPREAFGIYYRDEVGNISTSEVLPSDTGISLQLVPRFPLFGGWQVSFTVGYNLPLSSVVRKSSSSMGSYRLESHMLSNIQLVVVDHVVTNVILPEGSSQPVAKTSVKSLLHNVSYHKSYLDTVGRPVLTAEAHNIYPQYGASVIQVDYRFSKIAMLQEPLLLMAGFFTLFVFIMALSRLDFRVSNVSIVDKDTLTEKCLQEFYVLCDAFDSLSASVVASSQQPDSKDTKQKFSSELSDTLSRMEKILSKVALHDRHLANHIREVVAKQKERKTALEFVASSKGRATTKKQLQKIEAEVSQRLSTIFS